MRHLDLFSGIGGFALAARRQGIDTVGFCEIDNYCQMVLRRHWPDTPIWDDIRTLDGTQIKKSLGHIHVITGGFPCQPFSTAARGRNNAEDLWPEMLRIIRNVQPDWVIAENVSGNQLKHIERACADLARSGYQCWPFDISIETNRHQRRRLWIVAHANGNSKSDGPLNAETPILQENAGFNKAPYSEALGMDDGLSDDVDRRKRLRSLGNSIQPQIPEIIFAQILKLNNRLS